MPGVIDNHPCHWQLAATIRKMSWSGLIAELDAVTHELRTANEEQPITASVHYRGSPTFTFPSSHAAPAIRLLPPPDPRHPIYATSLAAFEDGLTANTPLICRLPANGRAAYANWSRSLKRCPMRRNRETYWEFACPECGFGHVEIGDLAADDEIHCVVCLEETDRHVVLHRWLAFSPAPGQALLRAGRVAA